MYAKEAFGDFIGYEVGVMKWVIGMIAWATLSVAFATALAKVWPAAADPTMTKIITTSLILVLGGINLVGVDKTKNLSNIITVGKLVPIIVFVAVGVFFIKGSNFAVTTVSSATASNNFGAAAILIFYAFLGFENIGVAAEDMANPERDIPIAILVTILACSAVYMLLQAVCIGVLGGSLAGNTAPMVDAAAVFMGSFGKYLILAGMLTSIFGINIAESFIAPRSAVALADDGLMPKIIAKTDKNGTPYVAIIVTMAITILIAVSGSFTKLAAISVVSRIVQYVPTCLAVIMLRKKKPELKTTFRVPFGPVIPIFSTLVCLWLLSRATTSELVWGLGALIVCAPLYFVVRGKNKVQQDAGANNKNENVA